MKKLLVAALFAITCITSAFAADARLYPTATAGFKAAFKNASDITWSPGIGYTKATFILNGVKMEAFYSMKGEMIGTSKAITLDELSVNAKRSFAKRFENYTVKEAIRFEGTEEDACYISAENDKEAVIVKVNDADQLFVIKTSKK